MTSIFSNFASFQGGVASAAASHAGAMMGSQSAPETAWGADENLWSRNTQYNTIVEAVVKQKHLESFRDLQNATKSLMPRFKTLLKNPPRNSSQREKLIKDAAEQTSTYDKRFVDEAVILSDLFNLNEVAAAGLLQAAEAQQPDFPGLTRGLVAVVLYYDSQRKLLWALRTLMQARPGRCWTLNLPPEVTSYIQQVTEELVASGIVGQLLDLVCAFDWVAEAEKLSSERGLGLPKHRKQVRDIYYDSGLALTEIVFCLAAQTGLNLEDSKRLLAYFRERDVVASNADASLGGMSLTLLMASLYAVDVSVLETCEDSDDILQRLPMTSDVEYMKQVHTQLCPPTHLTASNWKSLGALGTIQLAWGLALRQLSNRGGLHQSSTTLNIGGGPAPMPATDVLEQDEAVVEQGLANGALEFLRDAVLKSTSFYGDEFFQRVVHRLLTDFIVQMPSKLKELRNRADENARILLMCLQDGREPPPAITASGKDFQSFLQLIGEFYSKDPLGLELCLEFWCPTQGPDLNLSSSFSSFLVPGGVGLNASLHSRASAATAVTPPQRQVSLHKFVRSSGELLYPSIFVPYIRMLRGLANSPNASKFVNNMLKANCSNASLHSSLKGAHHGGSTVSWDHFFASLNQYFVALRHEAAAAAAAGTSGGRSAAAGSASAGSVAGNISNQELEGLLSVLNLVETIIRHDESTRISLADDGQYSVTVLLLGLAGCSVPPDLKAALFDVLGAFALTPEVAVNLWHALESSQVFQTARKGGRVCDVEMELAEIESRNEEYPITLAFVSLLDKLTDIPVPAALGAGIRVPGFTPHLEYLINEVLLKFDQRAYKDAAQKWLVARGALKILAKLLDRYQASMEHFSDQTVELQGIGTVEGAKPSGFVLMVHLLTDGALLKKLLLILHELTNLLLTYPVTTPDAEKECSLYILQILAKTMEKQQVFLDMVRETGSPLLLSKLESLILAINPRTSANDHITTIATYVTFNMAMPEHALLSIEIVKSIAKTPAMQKELLALLTSFKLSAEILHGFVECLEAEETEEEASSDEPVDAEATLRIAARQSILRLILNSLLEHPAPNFAHFLLGFDTKKPINKAELQDAGVLGSPLTCLHALIGLLNRGLGSSTPGGGGGISGGGAKGKLTMHKSARIAYHVIYVLCSNALTCGPAMRYLRSSADFIFAQVQHLPTTSSSTSVHRASLLSQLSWLLKSTAIELRLTSMNKQRSHVQRLIHLLLSSSPPGSGGFPSSDRDGGDGGDASTMLSPEAFSQSHLPTLADVTGGSGNQLRPKLLQILDTIDFGLEIPDAPDLNMFDIGALEKVIKSCQVQLESGLILCDVKALHEILLNEVNAGFAQLPSQTVVDGKSGGGSGYPQPPRQQIKSEIQSLLDHVVAQNQAKEYLHSQQQAFEAWRQVTEILLTACSLETHGIQGQSKNSIILLVLQHLTTKILDAKSAPELVSPAAGIILTLVSNLRQSIVDAVAALSFNATTSAKTNAGRDERTMLDRTTVRNPIAGLSQGLFANLGISVSQLLVVLKGLIQTVLKPGGTLPNERANLYGALLNYLHISDVPAAMAKQGASALDIEKLCLENANAINSYGEHFLEMVARDACDAHHVAKMLALSLLDAMVAIDKQSVIVHFLANKGYLQHLVDSLLQDDPLLQTLLVPNGAKSAAASKALYIYEAKLALLIRMATVSTTGATAVLHSAILDRFACCKFLDMRPDASPIQDDSAVQEVVDNFRSLLFPALKLSLALLTALGRQVASKVMLMIAAHAETFHAILRERHASWELVHVDEMNLVTAVLAKSSIYASEGNFIGDETLTPEFLSQLGWIERQMLNILPRFFLSAQLQSNLPENLGGTSQLHLGVLKVASNILSYCSSIAHSGGSVPRLVFAPTFDETANNGDIASTYVNRGKNPSLSLPLLHLQTYASLFLSTSDHLQRLQRKREAVQDLRADELQELSANAAVSAADEKLPAGRRQQVVAKRLDEIIETVEEQRSLLLSVMENLVFLLWRHLDVYLIRCSPVDVDSSVYLPRQQFPLRPTTTTTTATNPLPESQTNLTVNELNALKAEVAASLGTDGLFRKLAEIEQIHAKSNNRFSFLLAMVRRLKRFQKLHTDTNIC